MAQRFFIQSFGCRASQADGAAIEASLEEHGLQQVSDPSQADLVIVNTCTVTSNADIDARRVVRGIHRDQPAADILVTGCYAQRAPEELAQIAGVRWVVGNSHKTQIAEIVLRNAEEYHGQIIAGDISAVSSFDATPVRDIRQDRTRPNLKVQDGCSNRCSFCIIPAVRGRSRSAGLDEVVRQIRDLSVRYCEVVLSGINLGRWGRDLPGQLRFPDLVRAILSETDIQRLRISSIEPMDWSEDLLMLMAADHRIAKHVHAPLQSGSDSVLKRMCRKYRTRHYASRMELVKRLIPDAALGADVMAGFPGETDAEFQESLRFIEDQPFTYLHAFTYSERPGTVAAQYCNAVPVSVRRDRTRVLREVSERKNAEFRRRMIGKRLPAVTLEERGWALTDNFIKMQMAGERPPNQLVEIEVGSVISAGLKERELLPVIHAS